MCVDHISLQLLPTSSLSILIPYALISFDFYFLVLTSFLRIVRYSPVFVTVKLAIVKVN